MTKKSPTSLETAPSPSSNPPEQHSSKRLLEVVLLFLRLGFTAFGGPVAHIAMMRREMVERRRWLKDEHFMDLVGIVNLIPGPSSTELAIYLGYLRAGWPGLLLGGICFIGPAMLIVMALAWLYVTYGTLPAIGSVLYGIKAVVIAIIAQALWGLRKAVFKKRYSPIFWLALVALYFIGINGLILLVTGGLVYGLILWLERYQVNRKLADSKNKKDDKAFSITLPLLPFLQNLMPTRPLAATTIATVATAAIVPISMLTLFLTFLKIGGTLYGSGYVILAFLKSDFVQGLGWLTDRQVLDAVSIGQLTPGPVFTTATFIGYLVLGWQGALVATLAIFLPSFVFIAIIHPLAGALRRSPWTAAILDGVNLAAVALMTGVLLQLGQVSLFGQGWIANAIACLLMIGSLIILLRYKINSFWLILVGAVVGLLRMWIGW